MYSIRNRRAKAERILQWMEAHGAQTVMFTGTVGREDPEANTGIVERAIAAQHHVKVGFNLMPCNTDEPFVIASALQMPFPDGMVDFALANAIIEHVGDEGDQRRFVEEHTRVARSWVITTPNRWFPIEPHTSTILRHWNAAWRRRHEKDFTRLLSRREFARLLPSGAAITGSLLSPTFTAYYSHAAT